MRVQWVIKGVLLIIAFGVLFLWPWSYTHPAYLVFSQSAPTTDHIHYIEFAISWGSGQIEVSKQRQSWSGERLQLGQRLLTNRSGGWQTDYTSGPPDLYSLTPSIPFWHQFAGSVPGHQIDQFEASCPCWLLFLCTAAWPLTSFALRFRRRAHRRNLERIGHCAH